VSDNNTKVVYVKLFFARLSVIYLLQSRETEVSYPVVTEGGAVCPNVTKPDWATELEARLLSTSKMQQ
jgi:hypothetical protein